jgi:hypothetical protein
MDRGTYFSRQSFYELENFCAAPSFSIFAWVKAHNWGNGTIFSVFGGEENYDPNIIHPRTRYSLYTRTKNYFNSDDLGKFEFKDWTNMRADKKVISS